MYVARVHNSKGGECGIKWGLVTPDSFRPGCSWGVRGMALCRSGWEGSSLHIAAQIGLVTELNFIFQIMSMSFFFFQ